MSLTLNDTQAGKSALRQAPARPHRYADHAGRARRLGHRRRAAGRSGWGGQDDARVDRGHPPRGGARHQLDRHGRGYLRPGPLRGDRARGR